MKKLIWLLLLINFGLLAYFNLHYILPATPQVQAPEIKPEQIKLLSPEQIAALPKKQAATTAPSPAPVATACYEWGLFSAPNIDNAQSAVSRLALQATLKEQSSAQAKRYWVYRPPARSTQEAQDTVAELKALGIDDLFVVQEPKWKNAISFGIFSDEQLASKLLNELKAKGVKNVVKVLRNAGNNHASLVFSSITEAQAAELGKLKPEFPEAELKEVACR